MVDDIKLNSNPDYNAIQAALEAKGFLLATTSLEGDGEIIRDSDNETIAVLTQGTIRFNDKARNDDISAIRGALAQHTVGYAIEQEEIASKPKNAQSTPPVSPASQVPTVPPAPSGATQQPPSVPEAPPVVPTPPGARPSQPDASVSSAASPSSTPVSPSLPTDQSSPPPPSVSGSTAASSSSATTPPTQPAPPPEPLVTIPEARREEFCIKVVKRLKEAVTAHNKIRAEVLEKIKEDYSWYQADGTFVIYITPDKSNSVVEVDSMGHVTSNPVEWEPVLVKNIVRDAAQEISQEPPQPRSSPGSAPRSDSTPRGGSRGKEALLFGALAAGSAAAAMAANGVEQKERRSTPPGQPESKKGKFAKVFKTAFLTAAVVGAGFALTALIGGMTRGDRSR